MIDQETGYVIGVVTQREGEKQGLAIAISSLNQISGNLPIRFLKADTALSISMEYSEILKSFT